MSTVRTVARLITALSISTSICTLSAGPARAQSSDADSVRRELQQMRQQYDALLQQMRTDYETRLKALDDRLKAAEATAATTAPAAPPQSAAQVPASGTPTAAAPANAFNPGISVILDGRYASFSKDPATYRFPGFMRGNNANPGDRGFALGESEVGISSNIDQDLYGNLIVSFTRDNRVSVEEAYLQTTSLPAGFTLKAGRFLSGIGYLNEQHAHTWDFADAPLPYRAFLNEQLGDDGVQARWLAPTNFFLEFGSEAARGDSFPASGAANRGTGTYSAFFHVGDDINDSSSVRTGLSYLRTKALNRSDPEGDTFSGHSNIGIADFVYKWAPDGNPVERNLKLQAEYFLAKDDGLFNTLNYSGRKNGWYAQAVYQFMPRWRVGARYDQVHAADLSSDFSGTTLDNLGATPKRQSLMTDYSTSEFGRFRLQYNRDQSRPQTDNQVLLQYTLTMGFHPAHNY